MYGDGYILLPTALHKSTEGWLDQVTYVYDNALDSSSQQMGGSAMERSQCPRGTKEARAHLGATARCQSQFFSMEFPRARLLFHSSDSPSLPLGHFLSRLTIFMSHLSPSCVVLEPWHPNVFLCINSLSVALNPDMVQDKEGPSVQIKAVHVPGIYHRPLT